MNSLANARTSSSLSDLAVDVNAPEIVFEFSEGDWKFNYFLRATGKKVLFVFWPSALVRGKRHVPSFHRWSWAENIAVADVLCVSDPSLRRDNECLGAWFQGHADDWVLLRAMSHILTVQKKLGYERIVFCGSSLGGFVALQAGIIAPSIGFESESVRVFAENPQVSLPKYMWTSHMDRLARLSYGVRSLADVDSKYLKRLDVVELIKSEGRAPNGLLVIKESDTHHYEDHVKYLCNNVESEARSKLKIEVISASVDATGHTPLTLEEMMQRISVLI